MAGDIDMNGQTINMNNGQVDSAIEISSTAFRMGVGGVSTPALSFTGDTNTGIYGVAADTLGITAGGTNRMTIGNGTTTFSNNNVTMALADGDGAVLSVTNTYSGVTTADNYAIKGVGSAVIGIPGSQDKSYGGHFTAGDTNTANPDTIALFAQGHEDGAPNSYAAIFSGSAGGVVGINTMEPTVELEVSGSGKFSGALEIGGISDVSASIAAASGGGGGGLSSTPLASISGRFQWTSADDGERIHVGSTSYGPFNWYSWTDEPSDTNLRNYTSGTVDTTTAYVLDYHPIAYGIYVPDESKKVKARVTFRVENGNTFDWGFSMWDCPPPADGATTDNTVTLRAQSATTTADSDATKTYTTEFTTTSAVSDKYLFFLAEARAGALSTNTYVYANIAFFLVD
jgi:hypothetical protein